MKKTSTILILIVFLSLNTLFAIQPENIQITINQLDGSSLTLVLNGDDHVAHTLTTIDGFEIIKDQTNELYYYAFTDVTGRLKSTVWVAHNPGSRSNDENEFLKSEHYSTLKRAKSGIINPNSIINKTFPSTGNVKLLMVLVNFSDTQTTQNQQTFLNMMNQPKYAGIGSFKDYYTEVSGGQLNV
ncbi:MAG: hypothetical protein ACOYMD_13525, partial [Paludibacter sp.]